MVNLETKIQFLKEYFKARPDVLMAFVFGSQVKNTQTVESDVDIAVYFQPENKALEWEETKTYLDEDKIWGDVEKIVGTKTDFVVLNRAPATLVFAVMQEGILLAVKDRAFFLRFYLMVSAAAEYFREFVSDFWKIKERSASLNEIDRDRLIKIIDFLAEEISEYEKFVSLGQKTYELESGVRRNVERWAENIVNSSIDIAKIILASEKKRIPQTYREILEELSLIEGFDENQARQLARFAKLQNILAHEYLDIRFNQLKQFIEESESNYQYLIEFTKKLLSR